MSYVSVEDTTLAAGCECAISGERTRPACRRCRLGFANLRTSCLEEHAIQEKFVSARPRNQRARRVGIASTRKPRRLPQRCSLRYSKSDIHCLYGLSCHSLAEVVEGDHDC